MLAMMAILFLVALEPSLQRQVMPAPKYPETTSSETFPGTFWHFSDLHLEFSYTVGSNSSNLCHTPTSGDAPDNEEDGSVAGAAGAYGCDSPPVLVLSSLEAMARLQPNVSLILSHLTHRTLTCLLAWAGIYRPGHQSRLLPAFSALPKGSCCGSCWQP